MFKLVIAVFAVSASLLAGCSNGPRDESGGQRPSAHAEHSESPASSPTAEPVTAVELTVAGGKRTKGPETIEARVGDTVVIEVTSDVADELHLHGYDETVRLKAGAPAKVEFIADLPGVFEVELHEMHATLTKLRVSE